MSNFDYCPSNEHNGADPESIAQLVHAHGRITCNEQGYLSADSYWHSSWHDWLGPDREKGGGTMQKTHDAVCAAISLR